MDNVFTQTEAKLYHIAHETIIAILDSSLAYWTPENKIDMIRKLSEGAIRKFENVETD